MVGPHRPGSDRNRIDQHLPAVSPLQDINQEIQLGNPSGIVYNVKEVVSTRHGLFYVSGLPPGDEYNSLQFTDLDIPEPYRISVILETNVSLPGDPLSKTREVLKFAVLNKLVPFRCP